MLDCCMNYKWRPAYSVFFFATFKLNLILFILRCCMDVGIRSVSMYSKYTCISVCIVQWFLELFFLDSLWGLSFSAFPSLLKLNARVQYLTKKYTSISFVHSFWSDFYSDRVIHVFSLYILPPSTPISIKNSCACCSLLRATNQMRIRYFWSADA